MVFLDTIKRFMGSQKSHNSDVLDLLLSIEND
jgi:hypothetical protein